MAANTEMSKKLEAILEALAKTGGIPPDAKAQVEGFATTWAIASNNALEETFMRMTTMEAKIKEQQTEIVRIMIREEEEKDKGGKKSGDIGKRVNEKNGERHMPEKWEGRNSKVPFKEILKKIENWSDAVYPLGIDILRHIQTNTKEIDANDVMLLIGIDADIKDAERELKEFDRMLYRMLNTVMTGEAMTFVQDPARSGTRVMKRIMGNYDPVDDAGKCASHSRAAGVQRRATSIIDARRMIKNWENKVSEHECKYEVIDQTSKITALKSILPLVSLDGHFRGKKWSGYEEMRNEIVAYMEERTAEEVMKEAKIEQPKMTREDIDLLDDEEKDSLWSMLDKGKGKGKPQGKQDWSYGKSNYGPKGKGWGKAEYDASKGGKDGKGGKPKGKDGGKGMMKCWTCDKVGHRAAQCPEWWKKGQQPAGKGGKALDSFDEEEGQEGKENEEEEGWPEEEDEELMCVMEECGVCDDGGQWKPWNKTFRNQQAHPPGLRSDDKLRPKSPKQEKSYLSTLTDEPLSRVAGNSGEVLYEFGDGEGRDMSQWMKIEAAVDSAAVDHVIKDDTVPQVRKRPSKGSKEGKHWWSASNHKIYNEGEKLIAFQTSCDKKRKIMFQVAKVGRTLVSVDKLSETDHNVVLNKNDPRIECPNGEVIKLRRQNKVFILDLWIRKAPFTGR